MSDTTPAEMTLYDFIVRTVNNFVKWDVLRQMSAQADQPFSLEGLVRVTRRRAEVLYSNLRDLMAQGVVEQENDAFVLTRDPIRRRLVEGFMRACQNREFRLRVIRFLTRGTLNPMQPVRG
jgi:hypothetical protein